MKLLKSKKKTLIATTIACFACSLFAGTFITTQKASAGTDATTPTFEIVNKASVRIDTSATNNTSGIRFTTTLDDGYVAALTATGAQYEGYTFASVGTLIMPTQLLNGADLEVGKTYDCTSFGLTATEKPEDVDLTIVDEENSTTDVTYYNAVLKDVPVGYYGVDLTARSYMVLQKEVQDGEPLVAYVYADGTAQRSMAWVAVQAINSGKYDDTTNETIVKQRAKLDEYAIGGVEEISLGAETYDIYKAQDVTITGTNEYVFKQDYIEDNFTATYSQDGIVKYENGKLIPVSAGTTTVTIANVANTLSCNATVTVQPGVYFKDLTTSGIALDYNPWNGSTFVSQPMAVGATEDGISYARVQAPNRSDSQYANENWWVPLAWTNNVNVGDYKSIKIVFRVYDFGADSFSIQLGEDNAVPGTTSGSLSVDITGVENGVWTERTVELPSVYDTMGFIRINVGGAAYKIVDVQSIVAIPYVKTVASNVIDFTEAQFANPVKGDMSGHNSHSVQVIQESAEVGYLRLSSPNYYYNCIDLGAEKEVGDFNTVKITYRSTGWASGSCIFSRFTIWYNEDCYNNRIAQVDNWSWKQECKISAGGLFAASNPYEASSSVTTEDLGNGWFTATFALDNSCASNSSFEKKELTKVRYIEINNGLATSVTWDIASIEFLNVTE